MFTYGALTRGQGIDPRAVTFAVLDLETTGLSPKAGSRICEIGVVRMRGDGTVLDEYSTLVAPGSRITNSEIHGITDEAVVGAPIFAQIAGDVLARLSDAVVVGHPLDFAERHLVAEFDRLGVHIEGVPGLCSLIFARHQFDRFSYQQADLVPLVTGEWPPAQHTALGDARALAHLLAVVLARPPHRLWWWGPDPVVQAPVPHTRYLSPRAGGLRADREGWLAALAARLPLMTDPPATRPEGLAQYRALLARALAAGGIGAWEAGRLVLAAARAGLTQATARQVHEELLFDARARADLHAAVTREEFQELHRATKNGVASYLIGDLEAAAAADRCDGGGPLGGWGVLSVDDAAPGMLDVMDYAVSYGARVTADVTEATRLVIVPDGPPRVPDPRVERARVVNVPVVGVERARQILAEEIASGSAAQSRFHRDDREGATARRAAEWDAGGDTPAWHEFWRPRELTPPEYRERFRFSVAD